MTQKKQKPIQVMVEDDLHQQAHVYAKAHGFSLGALVRAMLRIHTNPHNPQPPPRGVAEERKRPSRRKGG